RGELEAAALQRVAGYRHRTARRGADHGRETHDDVVRVRGDRVVAERAETAIHRDARAQRGAVDRVDPVDHVAVDQHGRAIDARQAERVVDVVDRDRVAEL